jgi:hypothetical protein
MRTQALAGRKTIKKGAAGFAAPTVPVEIDLSLIIFSVPPGNHDLVSLSLEGKGSG